MSDRRVRTDAERIEKFLQRADQVLQHPIFTDRDPQNDQVEVRIAVDGSWVGLDGPQYDEWTIVAAAALGRSFLLASEDNHLPRVARSLQALVTAPQWQQHVELFAHDADQMVTEKSPTPEFAVAAMTVGDPSSTTGFLGPEELTRNYIYGRVVHEDEDRRQILARFSDDAVQLMVLIYLTKLMTWLNMAQTLIRRIIAAGDLQVVDPRPNPSHGPVTA